MRLVFRPRGLVKLRTVIGIENSLKTKPSTMAGVIFNFFEGGSELDASASKSSVTLLLYVLNVLPRIL